MQSVSPGEPVKEADLGIKDIQQMVCIKWLQNRSLKSMYNYNIVYFLSLLIIVTI